MIVIDSSVLVAILCNEAERIPFVETIATTDIALLSVANLTEARMVLYPRNNYLARDLDVFIHAAGIQVEAVTMQQADIAFGAFRQFGRGTGHRAKLNFGDCFAYALAKERNIPLLFKGDDFVHTDILVA